MGENKLITTIKNNYLFFIVVYSFLNSCVNKDVKCDIENTIMNLQKIEFCKLNNCEITERENTNQYLVRFFKNKSIPKNKREIIASFFIERISNDSIISNLSPDDEKDILKSFNEIGINKEDLKKHLLFMVGIVYENNISKLDVFDNVYYFRVCNYDVLYTKTSLNANTLNYQKYDENWYIKPPSTRKSVTCGRKNKAKPEK